MDRKEKKKQKREARRKLKKLLQFLTHDEKKALNKARKKEPHAVRKGIAKRPGIKEWILSNKPKRLGTMYEQGLLKKGQDDNRKVSQKKS